MQPADNLSRAHKRYALTVLASVYTFNLIDRALMMLFLQPIKEELHLSDTQLGFLTGMAFALFYATVGLPIARWADRGDRVTIASLALGLWGLTVMVCLLVTNYFQLVLARIAAAVGEAGCKPPTYSLVGDYFPGADERTRAMSVYWLGSPASSLISFIAGGWMYERYGWRMTFFAVGVLGLVLSGIVRLTLKDPRPAPNVLPRVADQDARKHKSPGFAEALSALWRQKSCRHLCAALILLFTFGFGLGPWYAAFMMRSHGMGTGELGTWFGLIFGVGGMVGVLAGGYAATRWFSGNERGQMRMTAVSLLLLIPCFIAFLTFDGKLSALLALAPFMIIFNIFFAPTYALLQRLVSDRVRATTLAVVMLLANLIGMGLGPQVVGVLSDVFTPYFGAEALRFAMLSLSFVALWASLHFWAASKTIVKDLSAVAAAEGQSSHV